MAQHDGPMTSEVLAKAMSTNPVVIRRIMAELFDGNHDALEILKWKDVVEAVERAINAVEEASVVIESIAVKHA